MKAIFKFTLILSILLTHLTITLAQTKEDIIYLADGSQKKGKVVSISDDVIKFSYTGEEVQYELKRQAINKIVFANGREESFQSSSTSQVNNELANSNLSKRDQGNRLAVIPFEIVSNDQALATDAMRREIQQACIDAMRSRGLSFQIQDPRATNSALTKAGIGLADIANHVPDELAKLLDVDYVVLGSYEIENKGSSSFGSGTATYNNKNQDNKNKGSVVQSNSSFTTINYNTKVQMSIYDSSGKQLFSDTRKPLFGGLDSYKGALKTFAKRIPLK
ncbi:hypothetical protein I6I99_15265 [Sphingobacterium multivorum]|uniref:Uncharacterized protein n=1 Tax=Sphingobacterium multivorum TaxID=28454 RepID=A0ABX7CVX5_SPHMU|nr:hypothetical protein [Sphingobacterium multivorum]QQT28719.1 hypothetical protein I6I99_15265 [Sphingobacterium multivorum]QQT55214.1 hypothetical protein I6I98_08170 [Sphingobacterium multivorum]